MLNGGLPNLISIDQLTEIFQNLGLTNSPVQEPKQDYTREMIALGVTTVALAVSCCCVTRQMWARRQANNAHNLAALRNYVSSSGLHYQVPPYNYVPSSGASTASNIASSSSTSSNNDTVPQQPLVARSALMLKLQQCGFSLTEVQISTLQSQPFAPQFLELSDEMKGSLLFVCKAACATFKGDELSLLKYAMDVCDALKALLGALPSEDLLAKLLDLSKELSAEVFVEQLKDGSLTNKVETIVQDHEREKQAKADQALADQRAEEVRARAQKARVESARRAKEEEERRNQAALAEQQRQWELQQAQAELQRLKAAREQERARQAQAEAKATREQAAHEQAARERAAREQAAREQAAREQAAREQAAREQAAARAREQEKAATRAREAEAARVAQAQAQARADAQAARAREAARPIQQPASRAELNNRLSAMLSEPPGAAVDHRVAAARQQQGLHMSGRAQQRVEAPETVGAVAKAASNTLKKQPQ